MRSDKGGKVRKSPSFYSEVGVFLTHIGNKLHYSPNPLLSFPCTDVEVTPMFVLHSQESSREYDEKEEEKGERGEVRPCLPGSPQPVRCSPVCRSPERWGRRGSSPGGSYSS